MLLTNSLPIDTNRIIKPYKTLSSLPFSTNVHLDSIKLIVPIDALEYLTPTETAETAIITNSPYQEVILSKLLKIRKENLAFGVNYIGIDVIGEEIIIELSAKVLQEQYFDLITINTIEHAIHNLNKSKGIKLKSDYVIENSKLLRADVTSDITVSLYPPDYIHALRLSEIDGKFIMDEYHKNSSIIFRRRSKKSRGRITIYLKYPELLLNKNKRLKEFFNYNNYYKLLRVEQNLKDFESLRKAFDVEERTLLEILNSSKNPNYELFDKIFLQIPFTVNTPERYNHSQMLKELGRDTLIEKFKGDYGRIKEFVNSLYKSESNPSRELQKYKKRLAEISDENLVENNLYGMIDEIRIKLKHVWDVKI